MSSFVPPVGTLRDEAVAQDLPIAGFLNQFADAALIAAVVVTPTLLGGVLTSAQLLLGILAVVAAGAWLLGQLFSNESAWNWLGVEPLIIAAVALLVLQFTPLPLEWVDRVSPELAKLVVASTEPAVVSPPAWRTLSVTPVATRHSLMNFGAYALLFLVAAQRVRTVQDAQRMLRWAAYTACGMAAFGLVHFLFSNGKFFWRVTVPHVDPSEVVHGSFGNRNHLAQFLALGIGPLTILALAQNPQSAARASHLAGGLRRGLPVNARALLQSAAWCALAVVLGAISLSMSRGGMIAAGAALVVCLAVCHRARLLNDKFLVCAFVLAAALVAALFLPGARQVESRVEEEIVTLDLEKIDAGSARRKIWGAVVQAIAAFPIVGTGAGSLRHVYPLYFDHVDDGTEYTTAESGFLQVALETGGIGMSLLILGIGFAVFRMVRSVIAAGRQEKTVCLAAVLASVAATSAQAVVETHWYMPGCMALSTLVVGCGVGLSSPDGGGGRVRLWRLPRVVWIAGLAGLAWCGSAAFPVHVAAMQDAEYLQRLTADSMTSTAADGEPLAPSRREMAALSNLNSTSPRAHLEAAKLHIQAFESRQLHADNPMSLTDLRQAAIGSDFSSPEERRNWLNRATSENVELLYRAQEHIRRCLELCALEGRAYLYAGDLCFLDGGDAATQQSLIDNARRVRPYHAQVDFAAGQLAWAAGDFNEALQHWRRSYDRSHAWRSMIARLLVDEMPADDFLQAFEPDWQTLRQLQFQLGQAGHPEFPVVARRFADVSVARAHEVLDGSEEQLLRESLNIYRRLDDQEAVANCALQYVRFAPACYEAHAAAARALQFLGRDREALTHLRWCLHRKPNDEPLANLFRFVMDRADQVQGVDLTNDSLISPASIAAEYETETADDGTSGVEHSDCSAKNLGHLIESGFPNARSFTERSR